MTDKRMRLDWEDVAPAPSPRTAAARAANIVALEQDSIDAVAEAVAELPSYVSEATRWDIVAAVRESRR